MKIIYLFCSFLLFSLLSANSGFSQSAGRETLDGNNIEALFHTAGDMFWDLNMNPKFEVPKGSDRYTIFASALWIGGMYNNNLHLATMTYRQAGSDFFSGPLDSNGTISQSTFNQYDKIWKITKAEIDDFRQNNTKTTAAILNWPAHGDTSIGQARFLAPFVDTDGDGLYDPQKGDYPLIKGDVALWWVFNDNYSLHAETEARPLIVEVQAMAYVCF